jgi:hypothetical protein
MSRPRIATYSPFNWQRMELSMSADVYWWDFATTQFAIMGIIGALWGVLMKYLIGQVFDVLKRRRLEADRQREERAQELQELRIESAFAAAPALAVADDIVIWDEDPVGAKATFLLPEVDKREYVHAA